MRKYYFYKGGEYTLGALAKIGNLSYSTLKRRIGMGWDIEEAVDTPCGSIESVTLKTEDAPPAGTECVVVFSSLIPSVYASMQPKLNKKYPARVYGSGIAPCRSRAFFIVTLEGGRLLIAYPDECSIVETAS